MPTFMLELVEVSKEAPKMLENGNITARDSSSRKNIKISIIIVGVAIALIAALALLWGFLGQKEDKLEFPPVDPSLLEDTKEEDFDIMEYDEYLALNRNVVFQNEGNGTSISINDQSYKNYGEAVELVYKMLRTLIEGDYEKYNSMVSGKAEKYEWFSQQQIYDVVMKEVKVEELEGKNGSYTEYVIKLKYKIHENNGSYRNNIVPDASRPQYIVINDSTGKLMIMDIIDTVGW